MSHFPPSITEQLEYRLLFIDKGTELHDVVSGAILHINYLGKTLGDRNWEIRQLENRLLKLGEKI